MSEARRLAARFVPRYDQGSWATEVEGEARTGFYWLSLKLLARLKSLVIGSTEHRTEARRELQRYASELIAQVNLLLDNAADVLESKGRPPDILIVQDNLDRLPPEAAHKLFFTNGDLLKALRAHVIYTAPVALVLAPWNISKVFASRFSAVADKGWEAGARR